MLSTKILAILTLLAVICFAGLVAVQYAEFSFFSAPSSVWPPVH